MARVNSRLTNRAIAAQLAGNDALARSVSAPDPGAARPSRGPGTTGRHSTDEGDRNDDHAPRRSFARRLTAPFRAFRHLNAELTGAGTAMARSNRFPQPRPQADLAQAKQADPVSSGKVLAGV